MDTEFRMVDRLALPRRLVSLIESGRWPRTESEALQQNLKSLVPKERIQLFAPEESTLYLNKPAFHTVAKVMNHPGKFWYRFGALDEIDPELSVEIGDFGFGSDSPILLDYRQDRSNPAVIRLQGRNPQPNGWVRCSDSFDEFRDMLGLDSSS